MTLGDFDPGPSESRNPSLRGLYAPLLPSEVGTSASCCEKWGSDDIDLGVVVRSRVLATPIWELSGPDDTDLGVGARVGRFSAGMVFATA